MTPLSPSEISSIEVPPSTIARLESTVKLLNDAARNLEAAAIAVQDLAPNEKVLIENLNEQVLAREWSVRQLREGCR